MRSLLLLLLLGGVVATPSSGRSQSIDNKAGHANAQFATEPAGAGRCQVCHASEVEGYARSAMAHSLRRAGQEPEGTVQTRGLENLARRKQLFGIG